MYESFVSTLLIEVHQLVLYPCSEIIKITLQKFGFAKQVVITIIFNLHEIVRRTLSFIFIISLVSLYFISIRDGYSLCTITNHCLILILLHYAVSSGKIQEGEHWCNICIMSTVNGQFLIHLLSWNNSLHAVNDCCCNRCTYYSW